MATRFGTSKKTKHVQLRFLFIQELVASGVVSVKKVSGTSNPSDVMTKYITKEVLRCTWIYIIVSHFIRTHLRMYAYVFHSAPRNCLNTFG